MSTSEKREKYNKSLEYNGQAFADRFVLNCTNFKTNGYFLELGSRDYKKNNNTYILEKEFNWQGVMVERVASHKKEYELNRQNSVHLMKDATTINYRHIFESNNYPKNLDFLQLDLEVLDNTALKTLLKINKELLNDYKFAVVTMEHDIFTGIDNAINTRLKSREILEERGYYCVFEDIIDDPKAYLSSPDCPYEDWWVHPDLVNMQYIDYLQNKNKNNFKIVKTNFKDMRCFITDKMRY
jgi:hypothetical protein